MKFVFEHNVGFLLKLLIKGIWAQQNNYRETHINQKSVCQHLDNFKHIICVVGKSDFLAKIALLESLQYHFTSLQRRTRLFFGTISLLVKYLLTYIFI